ncbi:unnamed protein product [Closterium sp. Naga37s-1]|nr:unnamed protein product [Closterium sp. Naga37s-1]
MEIQLAAAAVRALEAALKRKLEGEAVGDFNVDAAAEASALLKRARGNSEGGAATQSGRPEAGAAGRTDGFADRGDANNADAHRSESSKRPAVGGSRPAARGGADDVMPTRSELEAIWQLVHSGYFAGGGEGELREGQGAHEAADLAGASGSRGEGSLPRAVGTSEVAAREGRAIRKAWEESLSAQGGGAGERGGRGDDFAGGGVQQSSKKGQNLGPQAMAARPISPHTLFTPSPSHASGCRTRAPLLFFSPFSLTLPLSDAVGAGERTHEGAAGAGAGGGNDDNRELPAPRCQPPSSPRPPSPRAPPPPLPSPPQMRRERVNARMRVLQGLVPGAATMTTESFLLLSLTAPPPPPLLPPLPPRTSPPPPNPSDAAGASQCAHEGAAGAGAGGGNDDNGELPAGGSSLRALPAAAGHGAFTAAVFHFHPPPPGASPAGVWRCNQGCVALSRLPFLLEAVHSVRFLLQQVMVRSLLLRSLPVCPLLLSSPLPPPTRVRVALPPTPPWCVPCCSLLPFLPPFLFCAPPHPPFSLFPFSPPPSLLIPPLLTPPLSPAARPPPLQELSELYTPQNRNREEGEGESGEGQSRAGEGAGCSVEGGAGGKGDVDSELRREGLRLVRVDRLLPIVGVGGLLDCILVKQQQREEQRQEDEGRNEEREEGEEGMGGEEGEDGEEQEGDILRQGSSARSAEAKALVHVSHINRLRVSHAISRSQSQSRCTSLTVRAAGESGDTPATDSAAAAAASAGSKPTPEAASAESSSASGVPVLTIVAGVFVFALVIFALFSLASAILGIFLR